MSDSRTDWDCVVVGGGAAGLSGALVLGRARRRTLVVDAGRQSNLAAAGIGGLLGNDHRPPAEFYAAARAEVAAYPSVELREGEVTSAAADGEGFALETAAGSREATRTLLLAGGMEYRYPDLPGVAERWGRSVFHCPFCHGWEVRDKALGVFAEGDGGAERALLLRAWSERVTLLTGGGEPPSVAAAERLRGAGIEVDERPLAGVDGPGDGLEAVAFEDGSQLALGGLLVAVSLHQRDGIAAALGAETAEPTPMTSELLAVGPTFATSVPGLFAAGDLAVAMQSVANAVMSGSTAAAGAVHGLTAPPAKAPSAQ